MYMYMHMYMYQKLYNGQHALAREPPLYLAYPPPSIFHFYFFAKRRCWSSRPQATSPRTSAHPTTMKLQRLTRYLLAPRIGTMLPGGRPTTASASTCRYSTPHPCPRAQSVHARPPAQPLPHGVPSPLRVCAGPRFQHPRSVGRLKQHRHKHHHWHQHGGAACLQRRRPVAREGPDPLGDAAQGHAHRRRGGGCHRPFCRRRSRWHTQPLPHRRRRTRVVPDPAVISAVPTYPATLAALAIPAAYGSHWPWLCAGPVERALRAKQWVRWRRLLR